MRVEPSRVGLVHSWERTQGAHSNLPPSDDKVKRKSSLNQEVNSHQMLNLPAPWTLTSQPSELWEISFFKIYIYIYWTIVDLYCCVNFCCTAKWLSHRHIYNLYYVLFHYGLSQDIEYSSLCYTVVPCCIHFYCL